MADGGHAAASLYNRLRTSTCARSNTGSSRTPLPSRPCARTSRPTRRCSSRLPAGRRLDLAASRPGILTSTRPTCRCCCRYPGSMPATPNISWDARTETRQPHPAAVRLLRHARLAAHLAARHGRIAAVGFPSSPSRQIRLRQRWSAWLLKIPASASQRRKDGPSSPPAACWSPTTSVAGHLRDQRRLSGGLHLRRPRCATGR